MKKWRIPLIFFVGVIGLSMATAQSVVLYNVQGGFDGKIQPGGQTVNVPIRYLCPADDNGSVVLDVGVQQDGKTPADPLISEGEADNVLVTCTGKWKRIVVSVPILEGANYVKGKAKETVSLDNCRNVSGCPSAPTGEGVDVAVWPAPSSEGGFIELH